MPPLSPSPPQTAAVYFPQPLGAAHKQAVHIEYLRQ